MIPFFVFLFCLFATYATYLIVTRRSAEHRAKIERRLADALIYSNVSTDPQMRLTREELLSEIPQLDRLLGQLPLAIQLRRMIDQADLQLTVMRLFMFSGLAGLLAGLAVSMIFLSLPLVGVIGLVAAAMPFLHVMWKRNKRLHKFLTDLPDTLELMSRALAAGHAFSESLSMVSQEMPDPISTEFRRTYEENNLGLSFKLALDNLTERVPLIDLRICVTAVLIQRETGGNLAEILEKVAHTIRERFRILEDFKTLTTQSRVSAWILCGVPIFIAAAVTILNPDYMSVFWNDPRGHKLLALAVGMQIAGMLMVRKILRIKV
ncbi:MAG: type II secretion system F family protein [Blastocatellia bacterium]